MKKLIILASAFAVAMVANAASVSWSATSIKDIKGNSIGTKAADAGWLAVCTIYSDAEGKNVVGSNSDNTAAMSKFAGLVDGTSTKTTYYAQLVITDNAGNSIKSDIAKFTTDESAEFGDINFTTGGNFASGTPTIDYATGWKSSAAPEPTSGMLLLLGMAGLALRRKQK